MDFGLAHILPIGSAEQQMQLPVPALFHQLAGQQAADQAGCADDQDFIGHGQGLRKSSGDEPS